MPEEAINSQEQLILTASGQPFKTKEMAAAAITKKHLDKNIHDVVEIEDGWAISEVEPKELPEKYYRVRFHAKAQPNDPDDVILAVNGETLIIPREIETILPGRFKECADHATYPQFRQLPNMPRKTVANIRVYPYDLLGDSSEKEFKAMLAAGNKKTKEHIAKYGFNVTPEDLE